MSGKDLSAQSHSDIAGGLGIVIPGTVLQTGSLMLAARVEEPVGGPAIAMLPPTAASHHSSHSTPSVSGGQHHTGTPDAEGCILRCARAEDVGIAPVVVAPSPGLVHRVVITSHNDGFVLMGHMNYSLSTMSPVPLTAIQKRIHTGEPTSMTVRVTTAALREVRVGDKFASRHGQKGTVVWSCEEGTPFFFTRPGPVDS